jgi:hypothetical protein
MLVISRHPSVPRFWIGWGGNLTVTIGPRQAIAVHTGAGGIAAYVQVEAQQVSVMFYETATTTFGEVCDLGLAPRR